MIILQIGDIHIHSKYSLFLQDLFYIDKITFFI